jgi:hypothetical protein
VQADETSGLSLSRLATPLPPMLTSVNQIGFDFYDWIGGAVAPATTTQWSGSWEPSATPGPDRRRPSALFAFPVSGRQRGGTFDQRQRRELVVHVRTGAPAAIRPAGNLRRRGR